MLYKQLICYKTFIMFFLIANTRYKNLGLERDKMVGYIINAINIDVLMITVEHKQVERFIDDIYMYNISERMHKEKTLHLK